MSGRIRTEILSGKCIKPISPTPPHLQFFKLSLLDQLSPNIHRNITLFFPSNAAAHGCDTLSQFSFNSQRLQKSLSQTLTRFYPLAGSLHDTATIDCNDHGAIYIEARVHSSLSNFLSNPDFDTLQHFLPPSDKTIYGLPNSPLFLVRFTLFDCGGTALTISVSHKFADLPAFNTLLQYWTATCRGVPQPVVPDLGLGASLFPPRQIPEISASVNFRGDKSTARRFVFPASNVGELKRRVVTALGRDNQFQSQPSRVEVVLALIWRCAVSASRSKTGSFRPSAMFQAVNLRPRMEPPIPSTAIGNFVWPLAVRVEKESELELEVVVKKMKDGMKELVEKKTKRLKEGGGFEMAREYMREKEEMKEKEMVVYKCSSWSKNGMLEVDYGWGNPSSMSSVNRKMKNTVSLIGGRDEGVEAVVTLDEQEMDMFIRDQELLQYCRINPSVVYRPFR